MSTRNLCWVVLLFVLAAATSFAQTGTIQGILTDPQGAVIPNAKVTATDEAKNIVIRETTSGNDGAFYLRNLLPGLYTVRSEVTGFKALDRTGLRLDQNQIMDLGAVSLQVGQTSESVTIEAAVPLVETATANKSFVISSRQVTELSLNGRDFQSLIRTLPGVVSNDRSDFRLAFNNTDAFNINGLRGSNNNVFLDGTINTDVGANDGQFTQISLDAVGEFKVQTSTFNAEYGRNPGVLIAINTKSGTKDFHGTLYDFLRNNVFRRAAAVRHHGHDRAAAIQSIRRQYRRSDLPAQGFPAQQPPYVFLLQLRRHSRRAADRRQLRRSPASGPAERRSLAGSIAISRCSPPAERRPGSAWARYSVPERRYARPMAASSAAIPTRTTSFRVRNGAATRRRF